MVSGGLTEEDMAQPIKSWAPRQIGLAGIALMLAGYAIGNIAAKLLPLLGS